MSPKQRLLNLVSAVDFFSQEFPDWKRTQNDLVQCPKGERHTDGEDSTNSLSINPSTGNFYCNGCRFSGTSWIGYYTDVYAAGDYTRAIKELYSRFNLNQSNQEKYQADLTEELRAKLIASRGWTSASVERFGLGWSSLRQRLTIPIFSSDGSLLEYRYYDALGIAPLIKGKRVKMLAPAGGRTGLLFPCQEGVGGGLVWLMEGEPDTILARQAGLQAITVTGGAGAWSRISYKDLGMFIGCDIAICFDNDKAGTEAAKELVTRLIAIDIKSIKIVPVPSGKDFTEYLLNHRGSVEILQGIYNSSPYIHKPTDAIEGEIHLSEVSDPRYINKEVTTRVLINGIARSPVYAPKRVSVSCRNSDKCDNCPCIGTPKVEIPILRDDPNILQWIIQKDTTSAIARYIGVSSKCKVQADVLEWQSLHPITMIPALSNSESNNSYVSRWGYYLGHGIESNQNYLIKAIPTVHDKTKENVLLVKEATGASDSLKGYTLREEDIAKLRKLLVGSPGTVLKKMARSISDEHTRIRGRIDLHIATDLAFHSVSSFYFVNSLVRKATLDIILYGDTRCGKGSVAEGLTRLYDLGSVVSGENSSFMGLVGGAQKIGNSFELYWGRLPTNNKRLVVVDEFTGFQDFGRLSRIRSEGIAEIDKGGITAQTQANTRIIWISNPRLGRELAYFTTGVEALSDLIQAHEDIARFDLALAVSKGEVSIREINQIPITTTETLDKPLLRKLVLWAWSRSEDDIYFTESATRKILEYANELAEKYSPGIPLIQGENVKDKLAKISAAVAARVFSSPDGIKLRIDEEHAITAFKFLTKCYDKSCMGYNTFSEIEAESKSLENPDKIDQMIETMQEHSRKIVIDGMLGSTTFGVRDIQDWSGTDNTIARRYIGILVRCHAIRKVYGQSDSYRKLPAFVTYLRGKR